MNGQNHRDKLRQRCLTFARAVPILPYGIRIVYRLNVFLTDGEKRVHCFAKRLGFRFIHVQKRGLDSWLQSTLFQDSDNFIVSCGERWTMSCEM